MEARKNSDGRWEGVSPAAGGPANTDEPHFAEAILRYLNSFEDLFTAARQRNEFEFLFALMRFRGVEVIAWDPYETTLRAIPAIERVHAMTTDWETQQHLRLWLYGHIMEASEPYEIIANMQAVARGERFKSVRFPYTNGRPQSPGMKIEQISKAAQAADMEGTAIPLVETWDRDLRNAIFHSDYALCRDGIRLRTPAVLFSEEAMKARVGRAFAYHSALAHIYQSSISDFSEPRVFNLDSDASIQGVSEILAVVRDGHGFVGFVHPCRSAALNLQGQYMGYMRQLKPMQKTLVRAVLAKRGKKPAIRKARELAGKRKTAA